MPESRKPVRPRLRSTQPKAGFVLVECPPGVPIGTTVYARGLPKLEAGIAGPLVEGGYNLLLLHGTQRWVADEVEVGLNPKTDPQRVSLTLAGGVAGTAAIIRARRPAQPQPGGAGTVVYVHGMGNKPGAEILRGQWDRALFDVQLADRSRLAYWVDRGLYPTPAAGGALAAGGADGLVALGLGELTAFRSAFLLYAVLGVACWLGYRALPRLPPEARQAAHAPLGPSRGIVLKLAALFSVDSFAGGLAVQALLALWLFERFDLSLAQAGLFFFWTGVLSAFSFPVAAWLAGRIGLINTMVFTHIPSSLCLIAAMFAPGIEWALGLLLLRSALSQMDVPTRTSYVMAVVTPPERTAAASFTAVPRSLAAAAGPAIAGAIFAAGWQATPFIICGVLKIGYDLALLWAFRHIRPPEEMRG